MNDIEEEEFIDASFDNQKVNSLVQQCRDFIPNSSKANMNKIKSGLNKALSLGKSSNPTPFRTLRSGGKDDKDDFKAQLTNTLRGLGTDVQSFHEKVDYIIEAMYSLVDVIETLESRVSVLENKPPPHPPPAPQSSYASAVSAEMKNSNDRLNKLEYQNSEDDRKKSYYK